MTLTRVNTNGITDGAVDTADLADGAVTEGKLGAAAVTTAKVADGAVTNAKVASGLDASKLTTGTLPIARVAAGAITTDKLAFDSGALTTRNRIINGDMRIDQRNAGAAVTINAPSFVYTIDRLYGYGQNADGVFTVQRSTTAPAGFTNSALITVTTADASIGATQLYGFGQKIEGFNISDLGWGTANAQAVTVSFRVRSSLAGTFSVTILNGVSYNRGYTAAFTINAANTFETKTITIPGDTSGTWNSDNTSGLDMWFAIGAGSTYTGTAGAWNGGTTYAATGQVNLIGTNGATFYITGVQLEAGSVATPFERRPYGQELRLCQRYYEKSYPQSVAAGSSGQTGTSFQHYALTSSASVSQSIGIHFKVAKRATPTVVMYNPSSAATNSLRNHSQSTDVGGGVFQPSENYVMVASQAGGLSANDLFSVHWTASAEL